MPKRNKNSNYADSNVMNYAKFPISNTYYLGYRDIPALLKKYCYGERALDFGCGAGRSTVFLKDLGYEVIGVDIDKEMLTQAVLNNNSIHYLLIENAKIPVLDNYCDLVFACYVLLDSTMNSKNALLQVLQEIYRCLKKDGVFIAVTSSDKLYTRRWLSYDVDFAENKDIQSGQPARIKLKDIGVDFINYYWGQQDLIELFKTAGFELAEIHYPLGKDEDKIDWLDEIHHSPYAIYIAIKK